MAGVNLENFANVLKIFYLDPINEYLNNTSPLKQLIAVDTENVSGEVAKMLCHVGGNAGTGSRKDTGDLPVAGRQKYIRNDVPMKYHYGRIQFTGPSTAASAMEKGSWLRVIDSEIQGLMKDIGVEENRMLAGNGYGVLGRWRETDSTTQYKLDKSYAGGTSGAGWGSAFGAKYMERTGATAVVICTFADNVCTVAALDDTNIDVTAIERSVGYDTITGTDPGVVEAIGSFYVRPESFGAGSGETITIANPAGYARVEPMGLDGMVNDTDLDKLVFFDTSGNIGFATTDDLQGVSVTGNSYWRSTMFDHPNGRFQGQRALSLELMDEMRDIIAIKTGETMDLKLLASHAIVRSYSELLESRRRIVNTLTLDGGWTAVEYSGKPLIADRDIYPGRMYFLNPSDMKKYATSANWDWMAKDGSMFKRVPNKDAYEATLFSYYENGITKRISQGCINDLSYTENYQA